MLSPRPVNSGVGLLMNLLRTTRKRIVFIIGVAIAFAAGIVLYFTWKHAPERFYRRAAATLVAINGGNVPGAVVYRSSRDIWLIDMGNGTESYAYTPDDQRLYTCKAPQRVSLPRALYLLKDELPCVQFTDVKSFNPQRRATSRSIEFDSHEGRGRVKVSWF